MVSPPKDTFKNQALIENLLRYKEQKSNKKIGEEKWHHYPGSKRSMSQNEQNLEIFKNSLRSSSLNGPASVPNKKLNFGIKKLNIKDRLKELDTFKEKAMKSTRRERNKDPDIKIARLLTEFKSISDMAVEDFSLYSEKDSNNATMKKPVLSAKFIERLQSMDKSFEGKVLIETNEIKTLDYQPEQIEKNECIEINSKPHIKEDLQQFRVLLTGDEDGH